MKRIRLSLTGIGEVLTEAAEKRLEKGESYQTPTCSNGRTAEFYDDIGIPIPPDLEAKLKQKDKGIELEDTDFEAVTSDVILYEDQIKVMVTDDEFTTIFLSDGLTITVLETSEEIDYYLDFLHRTWFEKIKDSVFMFFRRIKWKIKGTKKVNLEDILSRPENQPDYKQ